MAKMNRVNNVKIETKGETFEWPLVAVLLKKNRLCKRINRFRYEFLFPQMAGFSTQDARNSFYRQETSGHEQLSPNEAN